MRTVQRVRFPQEWGGLWKREYGCRSHGGKPVLREWSTQSIRERRKGKGHASASKKNAHTPEGADVL